METADLSLIKLTQKRSSKLCDLGEERVETELPLFALGFFLVLQTKQRE
jgi:hypothetical protein